MKFSKKQRMAQNMIQELVTKFGKDRWFVQAELAGITLHTMNALVSKDYLDRIQYGEKAYYRISHTTLEMQGINGRMYKSPSPD